MADRIPYVHHQKKQVLACALVVLYAQVWSRRQTAAGLKFSGGAVFLVPNMSRRIAVKVFGWTEPFLLDILCDRQTGFVRHEVTAIPALGAV